MNCTARDGKEFRIEAAAELGTDSVAFRVWVTQREESFSANRRISHQPHRELVSSGVRSRAKAYVSQLARDSPRACVFLSDLNEKETRCESGQR